MKKYLRKLIALILVVVFCSMNIPAYAIESTERNAVVVSEEYDVSTKTGTQIIRTENSAFFTMETPEIAYCAQIADTGKIQFSYMDKNIGVIKESNIYNVTDFYTTEISLEKATESQYMDINKAVMSNIDSFSYIRHMNTKTEISAANTANAKSAATISAAMEEVFGENYVNRLIGTSSKHYNGTTYYIRCRDNQTSNYTQPESWAVAKDIALSAVITWLISGGWQWVNLIKTLVKKVVTTVIRDGIDYVVKNFTAERTTATLLRNKIVTVDGYEGTQYWSGWTRKMYFFKGDLGWANDSDFHYNFKHSDFDDTLYLLDKGYQNFIEYTL